MSERLEIFDKMQKADERIAVLKMQIARAKSDLFTHNRPTNPNTFRQWQTELSELQRKRQRLQFEMGEVKRREKAGSLGR